MLVRPVVYVTSLWKYTEEAVLWMCPFLPQIPRRDCEGVTTKVGRCGWGLALAADPIAVAVEAMRVGGNDLKTPEGDVTTVEVRRRGRDAHARVGGVAGCTCFATGHRRDEGRRGQPETELCPLRGALRGLEGSDAGSVRGI